MFSWFHENLRSSVDWHVMILFFGMPLGCLYESVGGGEVSTSEDSAVGIRLMFSHIRKDL